MYATSVAHILRHSDPFDIAGILRPGAAVALANWRSRWKQGAVWQALSSKKEKEINKRQFPFARQRRRSCSTVPVLAGF